MKRLLSLLLLPAALNLCSAGTNALTLTRTIPLPAVKGRIDHFAIDMRGGRLFMAALGNDTVEVFDLKDGKHVRTIGDCATSQGVVYVPGADRLGIANGGGTVKLLDAKTYKVLHTLDRLPDADNARLDERTGLIYVGYGDGALAVINATNGQLVASIPLAAHPESFQLEPHGSRIYVNLPDAKQVAVVDREKRMVIASWPMEEFHGNFPMALDESVHRLFVGCRHPARLVVLDTATGKKVGDVELDGDTDDAFCSADGKRVYAACGAGFIDVVTRDAKDGYVVTERIPTASGARTGFYSADRGEFYLAVRAGLLSGSAEVRVYKCNP